MSEVVFLRLRQVMARVNRSRSAIYADQTFPRPIKIGLRTAAWLSTEVDDWINRRIAMNRSNIPSSIR